MKTTRCIFIAAMVLSACGQTATSSHSPETPLALVNHPLSGSPSLSQLVSLADAEKIIGEPAHLNDSSFSRNKSISVYQCSYMANQKDKPSGKTGNIYFMFEEYAKADSAHEVYESIKKANENHGIKVLEGIGDEAYFHTDNENFYFVMGRKGNSGFRIKVNKITSKTSLDAFNQFTKTMVDKL